MIGLRETPPLKRLLIMCFIIAAASASTRWTVLPITPATFTFVSVSDALAVLWILSVGVTIAKYGRRGIWALIGAPLVLLWPVVYTLLIWACKHGYECL
jgi:hypothetical protein